MPKKNQRNPKPAPLLDELRSIEACAPEQPVAESASLCLLRVVSGLDAPTWSSLSLDHGLGHWCAVPLGNPTPKAEVLAQAIGQLAAGSGVGAPELHTLLRIEIERSRNCAVPLALALIEPDAGLPMPQDQHGLLELVKGLKRSFDHAARHDGTRVALVFSGASLAEAERLVGGILRRIRAKADASGAGCALLCSAGLAGYGGCVEFSPEDLLRRAATALANARTLGGNRLEVAPPVDADMAPRDTLVHASEKHFLFTGKKAGDL